MLYVLGLVASVCAVIAWFAILFTGKLPEGLGGLIAMYLRYSPRVATYVLFLREQYPPFTFETTGRRPG